MKKILTFIALLSIMPATLRAQDAEKQPADSAAAPQYWQKYATFELGFNQTSLWSWAAGGYNSATLHAGVDANLNYARDLTTWTNRLQLMYGFLWSADKDNLIQKSADLMQFESRFGYKTSANSKWKYSADLTFKSQFSNSYDSYTQDERGHWSGALKSGLFSPGYLTFGLGMAWDPAPWFSLNLSPVTGGFIFCGIPELRQKYGMPLVDDAYANYLFQLGAQLKMNVKASLAEVVTYETQLILFTDYLNHPFVKTRVNWDNRFGFLIGKYIKLALDTWLIYDPIVMIPDKSGQNPAARVQFKEFFSFNFTYTFGTN